MNILAKLKLVVAEANKIKMLFKTSKNCRDLKYIIKIGEVPVYSRTIALMIVMSEILSYMYMPCNFHVMYHSHCRKYFNRAYKTACNVLPLLL